MNVAATLILGAAAVSGVFAFFALAMSRAPGWPELRPFALIAGSASLFALCDVWMVLDVPHAIVATMGSLAVSFGGLHAGAWVLFLAALERRRLVPIDRILLALSGVTFLSGLVPGLAVSREVSQREIEWLGTTWHDTPPTTFGSFVYAFFVLGLLVHGARLLLHWRRGVPGAGTFTAGFGVLFLVTSNDALVSMGAFQGPYLLDLGLVVLVASATRVIVQRFVAAADEHAVLSLRLERLVELRTTALSAAQGALLRAEKLAAIGSLSAGIAHEINNPASVILASVEHLESIVRGGRVPPREALQTLGDATESTRRIARIVRQLLDAGRVASGRDGQLTPVRVRRAVEAVLAELAQDSDHPPEVLVSVDPELRAQGNEALLRQALGHLMRNAARAVSENGGGRVFVEGARAGSRIELVVRDEGPGMSEETQRRLFEPFSTGRVGKGTGLGLAVSLGLVRAQGGDLALRSTSPAGTAMVITLPAAGPTTALPSP